MKNFFYLVIVILILTSAVYSQNAWYLQYSGVSFVRSINFINNKTGWSVGYNGLILKTTNSGKDWINQNVMNKNFEFVQFTDINNGWIIGFDISESVILKTTNGGGNWVRQSSQAIGYVQSAHFVDNYTGCAVGRNVIAVTTNGGINWNQVYRTIDNSYLSSTFFINPNTGWVSGSISEIPPVTKSIILKTTNGGANWNFTIDSLYKSITNLHFTDYNTGWAGAYPGDKIIKTTDGGVSWNLNIQSYIISDDIKFLNSNTGWVVGSGDSLNTSSIMKTTNGGVNWVYLNNTPPRHLISISFVDSVYGWVTNGDIYSTYDKTDSNDVGVYNILNPIENSVHYTKCSNNDSILPSVSVTNFGQKAQNNPFDVHFEIRFGNNVVYHNIKQSTIEKSETRIINFDPYVLNFDLQTYSTEKYKIKSWTSLISDTAYDNDTAESSFSVVNPNYGYSDISGYYFLNSSSGANCIPDQPVFNWEDTTGSVNLIAGGVAQVPFTAGDIFNGCFRLPDVIPDGNKFRFFGVCYDTIVISTNGIIGLGSSLTGMTSSSPVQIPSVSAPRPAIFPFWYKCNFFDPEILGRNLKYKISGNKFIVTYDRLPIYNAVFDSNDYVSCQVILETSAGCGIDNGKITVQFDDSKSGSTFLNNYYNNRLNANTVGIQNSTGTIGLQYRRSESNKTVITPGPLFGSPLAISFGQINEVLPVELESFTSDVYENNVRLQWSVFSEINNSGFEIERQQLTGNEQSGWLNIGFESGAGNSAHQNVYSFDDKNLPSGKYDYRLKQIDFNGNFEYFELMNSVQIGVPKKFKLSQNYPNPFNPVTSINFDIPEDSKIVLKIYDNTGREVRTLMNEFKLAGYYKVELNGSDLASGVYFCNLQTDKFSDTKKMILLK